MASPQNVSIDQIRLILSEVINALESPDYASKLDEAKEAAGNEMLKMMLIVFPMVIQIEMEIIKRHGFNNSREGTFFCRVLHVVGTCHTRMKPLFVLDCYAVTSLFLLKLNIKYRNLTLK